MEHSELRELYIDELRDLYDAENKLVKALPKLAKASSSDKLRAGFEEHLEQTRGHVERLEEIFEALGEKPTGKKCAGMAGPVSYTHLRNAVLRSATRLDALGRANI